MPKISRASSALADLASRVFDDKDNTKIMTLVGIDGNVMLLAPYHPGPSLYP